MIRFDLVELYKKEVASRKNVVKNIKIRGNYSSFHPCSTTKYLVMRNDKCYG